MFGISGDEFVEHGQVDVLVPGNCSEHHGRFILYEFLDESRFPTRRLPVIGMKWNLSSLYILFNASSSNSLPTNMIMESFLGT